MRIECRKLGYGPEGALESFRHQWITDALERGVSIATVAELCGTSPEIIATHYSKLRHRAEHLADAAAQVRQQSIEHS
jgi:integrase